MNNNITKKYITLSSIIAVLIIILIAVTFMKNRGYSLPKLKQINSNISEITIKRGANETISIKYNDNKWTVNDKYNADNNLINTITNALSSIQPIEIVSRGDDNSISKYKLTDEEALTVSALDSSSKEVRNIKFGMKSAFGNSVYAKINNDNNIYLLGNTSSNPKDIFDKTENDLINKTISQVRNDDIEQITIEYNNNSYTLAKNTNDTNNTWIKNWNNNTVKANDVYTSIFTLANLNADGLITNADTSKNLPLYKINIQALNGNVSYEVLNKLDDNNYEIVSHNDNNRYYMTESSFNTFIEAVNYIIN
ncbi:hypothetical protein A966_13153 [Brachyspira hampsonii 30446]|uniref:DUF4340 domain-containing protein n=1 Tax=Brachyspira hampsonii 30446 TaxID=1289135 RepID=A0A2U4F9M1_9SPIR|nr:DUF4340 domain-containing protein [Brachyspira hampsonii]EKV55994.1 hypothetical protein A966_13153 [Brachyspira hampsonii 30446]MBW5394585.1 DUF4340 domain-containing protein [Brachyspira hampsonii]OEJ20412.1 hypothetical protein A9495_12110 [Brachyspira hampsonii]